MSLFAIRARAGISRHLALALAVTAIVAASAPAGAAEPTHGVAVHGAPALPADFDHFPYADPNAKKGGRLRVGLPGTFDSLNPFNVKSGTAAQGLVGNVFQTLMARSQDEPFTLYPLVAKSIEVDPARTHVTFHLDPRAHFSDGKPITSADVLFSFDLLKSTGRPQQRIAYGLVKSIRAPDAHTVAYDISGVGDRELPLILAIMPVLPKHATSPETFSEATLAKPLGSGPYVVDVVEPGARVLLRRDPDYWGADVPSQRGFYNFDEIDIQYFRDGNSLFEAFKAGIVDYRDETSTTRWSTGYDFPALRDGRMVKEALKNENSQGIERLRLQHEASTLQRHQAAGSARHDVRFRMGQRQLLFRALHPHEELFRRIDSLVVGPSREREGARAACALSERRARRHSRGKMAAPRQ